MKKILLLFRTILVFLLALLFLASCAQVKAVFTGVDTPQKQFNLVQKELNDALVKYKTELFAQDAETQAKWHQKYDKPIKALSAALDAWQQVVLGITLDTGQMEEFKRIKNELILLGWAYFEGGDAK